uniref:Uncharacterized protein n=1 Tax=Chromera velia CCMP2878 TaxID=1169474 RepID=A0A0G4H9M4_9ALVE|eukprot:Cvel_25337.t1-p1 / transcript=Cvel_25337.t1 / gene=Cvel_25337 / organism=Chromera_velia_CCMP2878 / gene_product=hypothetical protein / transcript_product=hypothetical protein / location=Cvel_scaffold2857:5845-10331(+) / protein_length=618 / sequence_SO=supercontig / SO=protein_coding / is_pseudo=false
MKKTAVLLATSMAVSSAVVDLPGFKTGDLLKGGNLGGMDKLGLFAGKDIKGSKDKLDKTVCGNDITELGEECDFGAENGNGVCTAECRLVDDPAVKCVIPISAVAPMTPAGYDLVKNCATIRFSGDENDLCPDDDFGNDCLFNNVDRDPINPTGGDNGGPEFSFLGVYGLNFWVGSVTWTGQPEAVWESVGTSLEFPNLLYIGGSIRVTVESGIQSFKAPRLRTIDEDLLLYSDELREIDVHSLHMESYSELAIGPMTGQVPKIDLTSLENGESNLRIRGIPNLETIDLASLVQADSVNLEPVDDLFMTKLTNFNVPNLEVMHDTLDVETFGPAVLSLPSLTVARNIDIDCDDDGKDDPATFQCLMKGLDAPEVRVSNIIMQDMSSLEFINAPKWTVDIADRDTDFRRLRPIQKLEFPSLVHTEEMEIEEMPDLLEINLPSLIYNGDDGVEWNRNPKLKIVRAPKLKFFEEADISRNPSLEQLILCGMDAHVEISISPDQTDGEIANLWYNLGTQVNNNTEIYVCGMDELRASFLKTFHEVGNERVESGDLMGEDFVFPTNFITSSDPRCAEVCPAKSKKAADKDLNLKEEKVGKDAFELDFSGLNQMFKFDEFNFHG